MWFEAQGFKRDHISTPGTTFRLNGNAVPFRCHLILHQSVPVSNYSGSLVFVFVFYNPLLMFMTQKAFLPNLFPWIIHWQGQFRACLDSVIFGNVWEFLHKRESRMIYSAKCGAGIEPRYPTNDYSVVSYKRPQKQTGLGLWSVSVIEQQTVRKIVR